MKKYNERSEVVDRPDIAKARRMISKRREIGKERFFRTMANTQAGCPAFRRVMSVISGRTILIGTPTIPTPTFT